MAVREDILILAALNAPPEVICPLDTARAVVIIPNEAADKAQIALRHKHIPVLIGDTGRDADIEFHQVFTRQRVGYNRVQGVDTLDYQHIVLAERYRVREAVPPAADEIEMRQSRCAVFDDILKARVDKRDIEGVDGFIVGSAVFVENGIALIVIKSSSETVKAFAPRDSSREAISPAVVVLPDALGPASMTIRFSRSENIRSAISSSLSEYRSSAFETRKAGSFAAIEFIFTRDFNLSPYLSADDCEPNISE